MIHREKDMPTDTRPAMRGGNGSVHICHLEKDNLPDNGRLFARLTLVPGASIGVHTHENEVELFYFAQGEGIVTDDGAPIPVKAGDSMTTPSGHSHSVENTGTENLEIIAVIIKQ